MRFKTSHGKEKDTTEETVDSIPVEVVEHAQTTVVKDVPIFTHLAVGVYHNVQTNQFHVVKVSYNPLTLDAGNVIIGQGTSRVESEYEFKTIAGGEIF